MHAQSLMMTLPLPSGVSEYAGHAEHSVPPSDTAVAVPYEFVGQEQLCVPGPVISHIAPVPRQSSVSSEHASYAVHVLLATDTVPVEHDSVMLPVNPELQS